MSDAAPPAEPAKPARKRFILYGLAIGVAVVLLTALLTSFGSGSGSGGTGGSGGGGGQPQAGDRVPAFTAQNLGFTGGSQVSVPGDGAGRGTPAVLMFFGAWCSSCQAELPPLTAAVRSQQASGGPLSHIHVLGVDSFDSPGTAKSFMKKMGVTFPVASDPSAGITSGLFYFKGDPYTVFVKGDGTISKVVAGAQLDPASFTADEQALIPSGT